MDQLVRFVFKLIAYTQRDSQSRRESLRQKSTFGRSGMTLDQVGGLAT